MGNHQIFYGWRTLTVKEKTMENNRIEKTAMYEECLRDLKGTKTMLAIAKERYEMAKEQGYPDYAYKYMGEILKYESQIDVINRRIKTLGFEVEE